MLPWQQRDRNGAGRHSDKIYPHVGKFSLATGNEKLVRLIGEGISEREGDGENRGHTEPRFWNMKPEPVKRETAQDEVFKHMRPLTFDELPGRKQYRLHRAVHR